MDIDTLLTLGLALAAVAGVVVAVVARRKAGPEKVEEMRWHLETVGVDCVIGTSADSNLSQIGHSFFEKNIGTLRVKGRSLEAINIVGVSSQYGTQYFLDFLVPVTPFGSVADQKKTRLVRKKRPAPSGVGLFYFSWRNESGAGSTARSNRPLILFFCLPRGFAVRSGWAPRRYPRRRE